MEVGFHVDTKTVQDYFSRSFKAELMLDELIRAFGHQNPPNLHFFE